MRVLFVTQYGPSMASSRTRVFQYLPYLHRHGFETRVITVVPDGGTEGSGLLATRRPWRKIFYYIHTWWRTLLCGWRAWRSSLGFDLLFVQKVIFPWPVRVLLRLRRPPVLFDFDDAIFTSEIRGLHWTAAWKERRNRRGLPAMLKLAEGAVVENDYTGNYAARYCRVTRITGPVDTEAIRPPAGGRRAGETVVVGWIGSASSAQYLDLLQVPLARLGKRCPGIRLRLVGAASWSCAGVPVERKEWRLEEESGDLSGFDIGIMPLTEDPWTLGKGGYKLLQYMASALPVVASPVGINAEIVVDGVTGYLAGTDEQWEEKLLALAADPGLRARMGREGRERVEAGYSLASQQGKFLKLLRGGSG